MTEFMILIKIKEANFKIKNQLNIMPQSKKKNLPVVANSTEVTVNLEPKLSSNDLIEIIAMDRYEKIIQKVEELKENAKTIRKKIDTKIEEFKNKAIKIVGVVVEDNLRNVPMALYHNTIKNLPNILIPLIGRNDLIDYRHDAIYLFNQRDTGIKPGEILAEFTVYKSHSLTEKKSLVDKSKSFSVKEESSYFYRVIIDLPENFQEELFQIITDHNKIVTDVIDTYQKIKITPESFVRTSRVLVNKKVLREQPENFKQKIQETFNIDL